MGFAIIFWAFGAAMLWLGAAFWDAGWTGARLISALLSWGGAAEFLTGAVYLAAAVFGVNPGWVLKDERGRCRPLVRLLFWPYILFEYEGWRRYRARGHEKTIEEIRPGLFIGSRLVDRDRPALDEHGITVVVDMVAEFPGPPSVRCDPEVRYLAVPVFDGCPPDLGDIRGAADFLARAVENGEGALVHCTFGHGRSATVAAAALIELGDADDPEGALEVLKRLERRIMPSVDQLAALAGYDIERSEVRAKKPTREAR